MPPFYAVDPAYIIIIRDKKRKGNNKTKEKCCFVEYCKTFKKTFNILFTNLKSCLYIKELDFSAEETLLR